MHPSLHRTRRGAALAAVAVLSLGVLGACSSDEPGAGDEPAATTTTEAEAQALEILVANDDGYAAEGIDALVEGLQGIDGVEVTVVAPLEQQSGQGGKSTEGELEVTDVELASGYPAKAVDGFPADSVRVAMDDLGIEPDLVVTGINEGQNLGPLVDVSGTVGAARAAVARGVPALSSSQGTGEAFDYEAAVPLIVEWVEANRDAILAGEAAVEVTNLNVPSCDAGELRGLLEIDADLDGDQAAAVKAQDCTSTAAEGSFDGDVAAFNNGFATISVIPAEPATPAEVVPAG